MTTTALNILLAPTAKRSKPDYCSRAKEVHTMRIPGTSRITDASTPGQHFWNVASEASVIAPVVMPQEEMIWCVEAADGTRTTNGEGLA